MRFLGFLFFFLHHLSKFIIHQRRNIGNKKKSIASDPDVDESRFAFVIEYDSYVGKRNGLRNLDIPKIYPSRLYSAPSREIVPFSASDGYARFTVDRLDIMQTVVAPGYFAEPRKDA